jgi:lipoprotein signal peptidase
MRFSPAQITLVCTGVFFLDRVLKYIAHEFPSSTWHVFSGLFGWEYFANTGIAFGIPIPSSAQIIFFFVVIATTLLLIHTRPRIVCAHSTALMLIFAGALSNTIDRWIFGYTIDYIRILTGVINIADVLIFTGVLLLMRTRQEKITPNTKRETQSPCTEKEANKNDDVHHGEQTHSIKTFTGHTGAHLFHTCCKEGVSRATDS